MLFVILIFLAIYLIVWGRFPTGDIGFGGKYRGGSLGGNTRLFRIAGFAIVLVLVLKMVGVLTPAIYALGLSIVLLLIFLVMIL